MENPIINGGAGSNIATKSMWKTPKKFFNKSIDRLLNVKIIIPEMKMFI